MREVFSGALITVRFDDERRIVHIHRSTAPIPDRAAADAMQAQAAAILGSLGARGMLLDLRDAVGRNDSAFEAMMVPIINTVLSSCPRSAVLVRTQVGRLHSVRLKAAFGLPYEVFVDEAAALDYLQGG